MKQLNNGQRHNLNFTDLEATVLDLMRRSYGSKRAGDALMLFIQEHDARFIEAAEAIVKKQNSLLREGVKADLDGDGETG